MLADAYGALPLHFCCLTQRVDAQFIDMKPFLCAVVRYHHANSVWRFIPGTAVFVSDALGRLYECTPTHA